MSAKANTNRKWTSSEAYRQAHDRVFGGHVWNVKCAFCNGETRKPYRVCDGCFKHEINKKFPGTFPEDEEKNK